MTDLEQDVPLWEDIKPEVVVTANQHRLLPFFGAALSMYSPTSLPLGKGMLHACLQGALGDVILGHPLFSAAQTKWTVEEQTIDNWSPEVVLQGLTEGLADRNALPSFYNRMLGVPPNALHSLAVFGLQDHRIPAIFTTNQDNCLEEAAKALGSETEPSYDSEGFERGLHPGVFHFHGVIGGDTEAAQRRRQESLTYTLNSMGPRLPAQKQKVLQEALAKHTLLILGYSGSDPDIWYSLYDLLLGHPDSRIYWCVTAADLNRPRLGQQVRLRTYFPDSVKLFRGDIAKVMADLGSLWGAPDPSGIDVSKEEQDERLSVLKGWAPDLTPEERVLAFGWLLMAAGLHKQATQYLDPLTSNQDRSTESGRRSYMMACLFAGFAFREMSEHRKARKYLQAAIGASTAAEGCRQAQSIHKTGESLSAFECTRFWYLWPHHPFTHGGAQRLGQALRMYESIPEEELRRLQLGRVGKGNALLNLGQLYRRTAAFTPGLRPNLARQAQQQLEFSRSILEDEGDMRSLAMVTAALGAETSAKTPEQKLAELERSIAISEQWNQDDIQIGSAHFAKAQFLAHDRHGTSDLAESAQCYWDALLAFRRANMKAEIVRTELDLAGLLARQARHTVEATEGSWEWQFGLRVLGVMKVLRALLLKETIFAVVLGCLVLSLIDAGALLSLVKAVISVSVLVVLLVILRSLLDYHKDRTSRQSR